MYRLTRRQKMSMADAPGGPDSRLPLRAARACRQSARQPQQTGLLVQERVDLRKAEPFLERQILDDRRSRSPNVCPLRALPAA